MFCPNCSCELPAVAKFCVQCGTRIDSVSPPAVHQSPQATADSERQLITSPVEENRQTLASARPGSSPAPYGTFVLQSLACSFLIAVACFAVCVSSLTTMWNVWMLATVLVVTAILAKASAGSWRGITIQEPRADTTYRKRHRRLIACLVGTTVVLLSLGGLFGWIIGKNRLQIQMLDTDLENYSTLGKKISAARNVANATIPEYVEMYKSIEHDVNEFDRQLPQLSEELGQYDREYPEYHKQTQESIKNVEITQRRMKLLEQQIAVAKSIDSSGPEQQAAMWSSEMLPILDKEEALNGELKK
jgi:zinc-ribbon domain